MALIPALVQNRLREKSSRSDVAMALRDRATNQISP
jgi:hypothetical protein